MCDLRYIHVLLPIKLEWEPIYSCAGDIGTGGRVLVGFGSKEYIGVVTSVGSSEEVARIGSGRIKPVLAIPDGLQKVTQEELSLWRQIASYYLCTPGEVYKAAYPSGKVEEEEARARAHERLRERLAKKEKQIAGAKREDTKARYIKERDDILAQLGDGMQPEEEALPSGKAGSPELSPAQTRAYSKVKGIFKEGKPALLRGVTGAGKTEIYLKLARETLDAGRNVLFMVPEIALSRQLEERIGRLFPGELCVCHSAESMARRTGTASFMRSRPYLVLGTRSSVFLPHRNLGLVVVDEEHDSSYKQDNPAPRYNGRETAIMLARTHGADIILGSATPSLESLYNCEAGRFGKVDLDARFFEAPDAKVEIIDTIAERKKNGMVGSFSRKLIDRISGILRDDGQVAILRERRAYSPILQCKECGHILKCRRCNAALSLHHAADGSERLICHYCGKVREYSGTCPDCGGNLEPLGAGTQKIEEEAGALFPEARIARLDSDSARSRGYEAKVIKDFSEGRIDILVGTRIVAKGFDFSGLKLVAVLGADSLLGLQDYRADERGLQLLEQFRGRSGRRSDEGIFVVQTSQPQHPVYRSLTGEDSRGSTQSRLLAERKLFGYPPYSRVVNCVVKDYSLPRAEAMCGALAATMRNSGLSAGVRIEGPYSPTIDKVSGQNIRIIRLLLPKDRSLAANKKALRNAVERFEKERKYPAHIALDVDPA